MRLDRRLGGLESPADFESFFRAQRPRLFGSMLLITGSTHEADELVQESFFKVWERWDRVGSMENPTGYLYRTALNAQRSAYRRAVRAARRTLSPQSPVDPYAAAADRDEVLRALARMTPRQRTAVVLTELRGYGTEEAATAMGIRPGTVRVLVSKGRAALRRTMEPRDE